MLGFIFAISKRTTFIVKYQIEEIKYTYDILYHKEIDLLIEYVKIKHIPNITSSTNFDFMDLYEI